MVNYLKKSYAWNFSRFTDSSCGEPFSDFPREDCGVFSLALDDLRCHIRSEEARSTPSDSFRTQQACLVVPA